MLGVRPAPGECAATLAAAARADVALPRHAAVGARRRGGDGHGRSSPPTAPPRRSCRNCSLAGEAGAQVFADAAQSDDTFSDGRPQVRLTRKFSDRPRAGGHVCAFAARACAGGTCVRAWRAPHRCRIWCCRLRRASNGAGTASAAAAAGTDGIDASDGDARPRRAAAGATVGAGGRVVRLAVAGHAWHGRCSAGPRIRAGRRPDDAKIPAGCDGDPGRSQTRTANTATCRRWPTCVRALRAAGARPGCIAPRLADAATGCRDRRCCNAHVGAGAMASRHVRRCATHSSRGRSGGHRPPPHRAICCRRSIRRRSPWAASTRCVHARGSQPARNGTRSGKTKPHVIRRRRRPGCRGALRRSPWRSAGASRGHGRMDRLSGCSNSTGTCSGSAVRVAEHVDRGVARRRRASRPSPDLAAACPCIPAGCAAAGSAAPDRPSTITPSRVSARGSPARTGRAAVGTRIVEQQRRFAGFAATDQAMLRDARPVAEFVDHRRPVAGSGARSATNSSCCRSGVTWPLRSRYAAVCSGVSGPRRSWARRSSHGTGMPSRGLVGDVEQRADRLDRGQFGRLDQMVVEAGFLRAAAILRLAPAGDGDQQHAVAFGRGAQRLRDVVAAAARACRRRGTPRRARMPRSRARTPPARTGSGTSSPSSSSIIASVSAASRLSSTTSARWRVAVGGTRRGRGRGPGPAGSAQVAARGRRTTNSLPWPMPVAVHARLRRHASRPGAAPASARCRARRWRVRSPCRPARTVRRCRAPVRRSGRCPGRARATSTMSSSRFGDQLDRAAGIGILGGVVEQVREHLRQPHARRRASGTGSAAAVARAARGRPVRSAASRFRSPNRRMSCSVVAPLRSSSLPRVMRAMSSRSSISRTSSASWRSIRSCSGSIGAAARTAGARSVH